VFSVCFGEERLAQQEEGGEETRGRRDAFAILAVPYFMSRHVAGALDNSGYHARCGFADEPHCVHANAIAEKIEGGATMAREWPLRRRRARYRARKMKGGAVVELCTWCTIHHERKGEIRPSPS
jgi:hypothetical protein